MLVSEGYGVDDSQFRRLYVGITRAKQRLYIHTTSPVFDKILVDKRTVDDQSYTMPKEIVLQLSYKDVYLDFFKQRKNEVLALRGGDELIYKNGILSDARTHKFVARLSNGMQQKLLE